MNFFSLHVNASPSAMQDYQRNIWKVEEIYIKSKEILRILLNNLQIFFLNIAMCSEIVFSLCKNTTIIFKNVPLEQVGEAGAGP